VATIGVPGCGKSTYAESFDSTEWVVATFDNWRESLWPPDRRVYYKVRESVKGPDAQKLLHSVHYHAIEEALYNGFNVVVADTPKGESYAKTLMTIAEKHNIEIEWKFFDVPLYVLNVRNIARDTKPGHRVPDKILNDFHTGLNSDDSWWRSLSNVEIFKYEPQPTTLYDRSIVNETFVARPKLKEWLIGDVDNDKNLALDLTVKWVCERYRLPADNAAEVLKEMGLL
jgi:predicted kinase